MAEKVEIIEGRPKRGRFLKGFIIGLIIGCLIATFVFKIYPMTRKPDIQEDPNHDLTLEHHTFSELVVDFQEPILGKTKEEKKLIVMTQEVSDVGTMQDIKFEDIAILKDIDIFNKSQNIRFYGTGEYTVDLSRLTKEDVSVDESAKTVMVKIPHPVLNAIVIDPARTKVEDIKRESFLALGDLKLTPEEQKGFETAAHEKMEASLDTDSIREQADSYAEKVVWELLQPTVTGVSPEYRLSVEFQE